MEGPSTLISRVNAIRTETELSCFLRQLAADFDFKGFLVIDIPTAADRKLSNRIVLSDMPAGFMKDYDALGLLQNSPVFARLRQSTAPVMWSLEEVRLGRPLSEADPSLQLFSRHSITLSVYYPVHGANGRRAVVGFVGNRAALDHTEMGELGIFVMHAYDVYSKLKSAAGGAASSLTARELEVLHWASSGKTSLEIATIIDLSDHTVNSYMNSAMRKLDCVNRTHLVAKALRLHLIS